MDLPALITGLRQARVVDLSQTLEEHIPNFPTHSRFFHDMWGSYWHGDRALTYQLVMNEHNGTHVDAPAHFVKDPKPGEPNTIEQLAPGRLIARGVRIDCRGLKEGDYLSADAIRKWEEQHGTIERGDVVLFNFGWSEYWRLRPDNHRYLNDWPGVSMEAAEYLVRKSVTAIGVDTLSPDPPAALASTYIHRMVLENQVLIIENLTRLEELPDRFLFMALPLKIRKGSGSPVRAIALVPGAE